MRDQKGLTLIELLVAIVLVGVIIVPLLTIMTGTFTRTVSQDKETQMAYIAQEVVEKVINHRNPLNMNTYCWSSTIDACSGLTDLPAPYNEISTNEDVVDMVKVEDYENEDIVNFNKVTITVTNDSWISNGPQSGVIEKENAIELITVVRKPIE